MACLFIFLVYLFNFVCNLQSILIIYLSLHKELPWNLVIYNNYFICSWICRLGIWTARVSLLHGIWGLSWDHLTGWEWVGLFYWAYRSGVHFLLLVKLLSVLLMASSHTYLDILTALHFLRGSGLPWRKRIMSGFTKARLRTGMRDCCCILSIKANLDSPDLRRGALPLNGWINLPK